ncbi:hypothetical protein [Nitrospira sp. Kam-Ns4a]
MQNEKLKTGSVRHLVFFILPFAWATIAACAIPQVPSQIIYEDPVNFVRLEADPAVLPTKPETRHSHPAQIEPEVMAGILRGFLAREHRTSIQRAFQGEANPEPVFRDDEVALLAPRLSEALARAAPDQVVTYYLSQPQSSIKREITTGGLYVHGPHLHFVLGNYRTLYGIPAYGMVYDRRYPMMPIVAKWFDLLFEPAHAVVSPAQNLWDRLLGREKDELVLDLRKLAPARPVA